MSTTPFAFLSRNVLTSIFLKGEATVSILGRSRAAVTAAALALVTVGFSPSPMQAQTVVNFTTAGNTTWTCPTGVTTVQVETWGGGGGGGACGVSFSEAGGGAGGSYVKVTSVNVTPGNVYQLTVGAAGTAGASISGAATSGGTGGSSYFGNTTAGNSSGAAVLAVGGPGGTFNNTAGTDTNHYTISSGATGTTSGNIPSSGAAANTAGSNGGTPVGGSTKGAGAGGAGANGGTGGAGTPSAGNGSAGNAPGGGGGGGEEGNGYSASNGAGGAGAIGKVALTYTAVVATPTISESGTVSSLSTLQGTPSTPTSFSASGANLTASITVTAPTGFEISTTAGSGYAGSLTLSPSGGTVAATTIYVRLSAADAAGSYSGNVTLTSTGATTVIVSIPASTVVTPFTQGNLTAVQLATSATSSIFSIIELSPSAAAQSTPVNSYQVPSSGSSALRQSNAGSTGRLDLSNDGTLLAFTGFEDPTGVTDETTITQRGAATLNANYQYALQASYTGVSGNQVRGATFNSSTWYLADKGGIYLNGSTSPANATNVRPVKSFGGTVYALTQNATTPPVIETVSADGTTLTGLPGLSGDNSAVDFYMLSSGVNGSAFDILYVLDGATVTKYSLVGSTWVANGGATAIGVTGDGFCAADNGTGAYLYVSTGATNTVVRIADTAGYNAAPAINTSNDVTLFTASTGFIKGVCFAPVPTPLPDLLIGVSAPAQAGAGAPFSYAITTGNSGAATATGVNFQMTLPTGVTFVSAADGGSGGFTVPTSATTNGNGQQVVTFTGGTLATGATDAALSVTVTASATGTYKIDAGATATVGDGSAAINTSTTTPTPLAELSTANNYPNISASTGVVAASISVSGTPSALSTTYGTASTPTTFSASGSALTSNIVVTAPTGLEVSVSSGSGYASSLMLTPTGGTVTSTPIYVRLTAAAQVAGSPYSGSVTLTSTGANSVNESIPSSTVSPKPLTLSSAAVTTKPWDGTTAATISGTLNGIVSGDAVTLVGTGIFSSAADGTHPVTSTSSLTGTSAGNYTLTQPTGLTGTITASANLGNLTSSTGGFTQAFMFGSLSYSEYVGSGVTGATFTPTADAGATVTVNGASASAPVTLGVGSNTITVVVTNDGQTQTYTVNVVRAGAFTAGDIVVSVYGNLSVAPVHSDGQTTVVSYAEFSPSITANSVPVMAFPLPSAASGGNVGITGEYGTSSEARIQLSSDGQNLTEGGYSAAQAFAYAPNSLPNGALAQSPCATVPRVMSLVNASGAANTSSVFNDIYNLNNPRCVFSPDNVNLYMSGQGAGASDEGGLYYSQVGTNTTSGGAAPTGIFNGVSTRFVQAYQGNLYYSCDQNSSSKGTQTGIFMYTGLPTSAANPLTNTGTRLTPASSGGINFSPEGFYFANATTMYVADTGDPKAGGTGDGGIQKWIYNGAQWTLEYSMTDSNFLASNVATTAAHGETGFEALAVNVVNGVASIYAVSYTAGDADPNGLYGITDTVSATSPTGTFTEIEAAPGLQAAGTTNPDYIFKGVSFAPVAINSVAASNITDAGATLNGSVNPNGTDTVVYFQYGTSTAYGMATSSQDLGSGTSSVPFGITIGGGLQPGTTYDYQLVTVVNGVTTYYANQTFTTTASAAQPTDTPTMPVWGLMILALTLMGMATNWVKPKARNPAH